MVNLISLGTALLGFLLVLPLFVLGVKRRANIWLGLFVYAISSLALADYCASTGVYLRVPQLRGVFDWPVAGIGAFFYCYVRSLLGLPNGWRQSVHFLPQLLLFGLLLKARLFIPDDQLRILVSGQPGAGTGFLLLFFQLLAAAYAVAVLYRLHQYRLRLRENYSSTHDRDLVWLQWLTLAVLLLLFVWFPAAQAGGLWGMALLLGRIGILYAFAWYGLHHTQVFLPPMPVLQAPQTDIAEEVLPEDSVSGQVEFADGPDTANEPEAAGKIPARYARSGMTTSAQLLIGERLAQRMTRNRDYLENDLKLTELAERIGTSPQLLSEYLNVALQQKFFDYINGLRISEVQRQLQDGHCSSSGETLLDLALRCGFNSKSTFNAAFKKSTGMTPSAWRAKQGSGYEPIGQDD